MDRLAGSRFRDGPGEGERGFVEDGGLSSGEPLDCGETGGEGGAPCRLVAGVDGIAPTERHHALGHEDAKRLAELAGGHSIEDRPRQGAVERRCDAAGQKADGTGHGSEARPEAG